MNKGYIYKYESPEGKSYIGQTMNKNKRHINHIYDVYTRGSQTPFHQAVRKYGMENFKYEILNTVEAPNREILQEWLNKIEIIQINKYKTRLTGYNVAKGGGACKGLKGEKNPRYGVRDMKEKSSQYKRIFVKIQNKETKEIREYNDGIMYIAKDFGYDSASLSHFLLRLQPHAQGWILLETNYQKKSISTKKKYRVTYQNIHTDEILTTEGTYEELKDYFNILIGAFKMWVNGKVNIMSKKYKLINKECLV